MSDNYKRRFDAGLKGACSVMNYCPLQKDARCMKIELHPDLYSVLSCFEEAYRREQEEDWMNNPGLLKRVFGDFFTEKVFLI